MTRIVMVEDNPDNRLLVEAILEDLFDLVAFDNGPDALAALPELSPDLILLDISLPGMDGVQVLAEMRQDARLASIPVIALTAHAMSGDRERFLNLGFDAYVTKPLVDEDILLDAIDALLTEPRQAAAGG